HPDILEFITCKTDTKEITNFNISVAVTDTFMKASLDGEVYDLVNPRSGKVVTQLNAREVLHKIAECAWRNGEPGLFFIDQANRTNPTPHYAMIEATNPCGEQPLLPYESCNLGSINLENHLTRTEDGRHETDWTHLERNSYVTTVAPTGTISMIADTSGGCEPEFSLIWFKNVMDGEHLPYILDIFIETAKLEGFWREGLLDKILANHGSARGLPEI